MWDHMWDQLNPWLAGGGLVLGAAFGIIAQRSRFCVVSAVSNFALMRDYRQVHAYLAALGVAAIGTFALEWADLVTIAESSYRRPALNWLGALGGGLLFGIGSMLAGGCASRTLVRTAEGNLGALLTLIAFALSGMAMLFGLLGPVQTWVVEHALPIGAGDASVSVILQWPPWALPLAVGIACLAGILWLGDWRDHRGTVLGGAGIGLLVVAGWWVTGVLGVDEFDPQPPASLTFAAPLARSVAWFAMGQPTGSAFALSLVPGTLLGALAAALVAGSVAGSPRRGSGWAPTSRAAPSWGSVPCWRGAAISGRDSPAPRPSRRPPCSRSRGSWVECCSVCSGWNVERPEWAESAWNWLQFFGGKAASALVPASGLTRAAGADLPPGGGGRCPSPEERKSHENQAEICPSEICPSRFGRCLPCRLPQCACPRDRRPAPRRVLCHLVVGFADPVSEAKAVGITQVDEAQAAAEELKEVLVRVADFYKP